MAYQYNPKSGAKGASSVFGDGSGWPANYGYGSPSPQMIHSQQLYKTALCTRWETTGQCHMGAHCSFAHGKDELRALPAGGMFPPSNPISKTKMCKNYAETGQCSYGERCHFAHGEHEIRTVVPNPFSVFPPMMQTHGKRVFSNSSFATQNSTQQQYWEQQKEKAHIDETKKKTRFCKNYTHTGTCTYNDKCAFIHDDDAWELQAVISGDCPISGLKETNKYRAALLTVKVINDDSFCESSNGLGADDGNSDSKMQHLIGPTLVKRPAKNMFEKCADMVRDAFHEMDEVHASKLMLDINNLVGEARLEYAKQKALQDLGKIGSDNSNGCETSAPKEDLLT